MFRKGFTDPLSTYKWEGTTSIFTFFTQVSQILRQMLGSGSPNRKVESMETQVEHNLLQTP